MKRVIALLLCVAMLATMLAVSASAASNNGTMETLVDSYSAGSGSFALRSTSRLFVVSDTAPSGKLLETLQIAAARFASLEKPSGLTMPIVYGSETEVHEADIVIREVSGLAEEAYRIEVTTSNITVSYSVGSAVSYYGGSSSYNGLHYGLQTVLKCMLVNGSASVACGTINDAPDTTERTLMLDCARKYWSVEWIKNLIREMSWMGYNTLELHMTDDQGIHANIWRDANGDVVTDCNGNDFGWLPGYKEAKWASDANNGKISGVPVQDPNGDSNYNRDELIEILNCAKEYHIEVIPGVDVPGHCDYLIYQWDNSDASGSFTFNYKGTNYSNRPSAIYISDSALYPSDTYKNYGTLDVTDDYTKNMSLALIEAYAAFFQEYGNSTKMNIGCDEIRGSLSYDSFVNYVNEVCAMLKSHDYSVRAFNDCLNGSSSVELDKDLGICWWSLSDDNISQRISEGRACYNGSNNYCYYVLRYNSTGGDARSPDNYWWSFHHSTEDRIYNEWNPSRTYTYNVSGTGTPSISGGYFHIWCDWAGWNTESQVWNGMDSSRTYNLIDRMWSNSVKMWNWDINSSLSYSDYSSYVATVRHYPGYTSCSSEPSIPDGAARLADGVYTLTSVAAPTLCVAVNPSGGNVETAAADNTAAQQWVLRSCDDGYYSLENVSTRKVLDVANVETANGTNICTYTANETDAQKWYLKDNGDGSYSLLSKCNGLAMHTDGTDVGANLYCRTVDGSSAQKWQLKPQAVLQDGVYLIRNSADTNYHWDIANCSTEDGANLQVWAAEEIEDQHRFAMQHDEEGYYTIRALHSGKLVDVDATALEAGTNIQQYTPNGTDAQKWLIIQNSDGSYSFVSKCNGRYLDLEGGGQPINGQNIFCWTGNGTTAQKWYPTPTSNLTVGEYIISAAGATSLRVCAADGGIRLRENEYASTFELRYASDGRGLLQDKDTQEYLCINADGTVGLTAASEAAAHWNVITNTDGSYSFVAAENGRYLNPQGCAADGALLTANGIVTAEDSCWKLTPSGHSHTYTTTVTRVTCEQDGYTIYTCTVCGYTYTGDIVTAIGHTAFADAAVSPTCTETGLTEGSHCAVCNEILTAQKVIAALGHFDHDGDRLCDRCGADISTTPGSYTVASSLSVGDKIVIVAEYNDAFYAAANEIEPVGAIKAVNVLAANGMVSFDETADVVWTVIAGSTEGKFLLQSSTGNYMTYVGSGTSMKLGGTGYEYTITCGEGNSTIDVGTIGMTHRQLGFRVYAAVPQFRAYAASNVTEDYSWVITIYKSSCIHNWEITETVDATCTAAGRATYTCAQCGDSYTTVIAATGHTAVTEEAVEPTCTETGLTEGSHCAVCNEILTVQKVIVALGHIDEDGDKQCDRCGVDFSMTPGSYTVATSLSVGDKIVIVAEYNGAFYAAANEIEPAGAIKAVNVLVANGMVSFDETADVVWTVIAGSTEGKFLLQSSTGNYMTYVGSGTSMKLGGTGYEYTITCGEGNSTIDVGTIGMTHRQLGFRVYAAVPQFRAYAASNVTEDYSWVITIYKSSCIHNWEITETVDATCTAAGRATYTCAQCGDSYTTVIAATGHTAVTEEAVEPTCTETGLTEGSHCAVCNEILIAQETIDALGHAYAYVVTQEATCTQNGTKTYTCGRCDDSYTEDIQPLGHIEVIDAAMAATCTETGLTEGKHCSRCNAVLLAQETAAALGHDYKDTVTEPNCTEGGYTTHTCGRCGSSFNDTATEPLGHTPVTDTAIAATCTENGLTEGSHCSVCDAVLIAQETVAALGHSYAPKVVPPTYLEQGYTAYLCTRCSDSYIDDYTEALPRVPIADAELTLEYTKAYYKGAALEPEVTILYDGEAYDAATELKITYTDNNKVGTATVTIAGINKFVGTTTLTFEISYERIPEQIINVAAIGEIGKISISWAISAEVDTAIYRIYRKAETETNYTLLQTIHGRDTLSYSDTVVERDVIYSYYVTGVGIYGEESVPSTAVSAQMAIDREAPVITKVWPAGNTRISGTTCLTATVIDNIGVTRVVYQYSTDGESWTEIGNSEANSFAQSFDTTALEDGIVSVRAIAFDAEGNASAPYNRTYYVDNTPPEQVAGVTATALYCSKLTLSWDDVASDDRASFVVQMQNGDGFATLAAVSTIGYNVTGLKPNTAYTFRVACRDTCGNQGLWSEEYTVTTPVDTVAPTITALSPEPCRLNSDLSFSATAKDECGITSIAIQLSTDLENWTTLYRQNYSELKESQTCKYTVHSAQYEEGYIYLRAVATDGSGNVSKEDGTAAYNGYLIDRTAPTAPTGVSATGCNGYIAVAWTQGTEADLGTYSVYRATTADGTYTRIAAGLKYLSYYDRTVETDLVYYYKVAVSDTCGNLSGFSETVSAKTVDDTQPPVVNSFSETYHQCVSDSYHTISVLATDNNRLRELVVEYKTAEDAPYSLLSTVTGINDYSKTLSVSLPIAELSHNAVIYLRAYAVDSVGLQSEYLTAEYTVDREAPAVKNFAAALEGNVCTLTWSDCGESDLSGFRVYRSTDGGAYSSIGSRSVKSDGSYSFVDTVSSTATHTYTYKLTAVDKLGNAQSVTEEVTYTARSTNAVPRIMMDVPVYMEVGVENYFDATGSTDDGAIESYLWDFGDGTTSALAKAVKKYAAAGTYTVSLTVTDDNGAAATESYTVTVKERSALGTLNVKVCDEDYHALPGVKVWFDKGEDTETYAYTNAEGIATAQLPTGEHVIAAYMDSKHLPAKKTVTVLSNASRTVSLILVEEELVTGEFEITRMTLDEIVAAGIDIYDPANQNIYQVKVQVTYGNSPLTISYTRNDTSVLSYTITDSNGKPVQNNTVKDSNGEGRVLTPTVIACGSGNADIVAILDIPAQTSYLKDFFDVKLYITNHASEEFDLTENEITLNIPEGMTLMTGLTGYANSNIVSLAGIAGQETVMMRWCLRGDIEGSYDLTADYIGTLTYFDEVITATFQTDEPIKVYGLNGIEMSILSCNEIHSGAFYFKIGLENLREVDLLLPNIGLYGIVENVTESVANDNKEDDFTVQAYLLNAYVESSGGAMKYLPIEYDSNGNLVAPVDVLAPGQKMVYEYVAYNAVASDTVGYFNSAMAETLSGYAENVVVGSYERAEYSYVDFSEKLDRILNQTGADATDTEIHDAYQYIATDDYYYYYRQGNDTSANIFEELYQLLDTVLTLDFSNLTDEEQETLMQNLLVGILTNGDVVKAIDDYTNLKYYEIVSDAVSSLKVAVLQDFDLEIGSEDFNRVLKMTAGDISTLVGVLRNDGEDAFREEVSKLFAIRLAGLAIDIDAKYIYDSYDMEDFLDYATYAGDNKFFQSAIATGMRAMDKTMWQAYVYSCLRAGANVEYSTFLLEAIISYCETAPSERSLAPMLKRVADDMLLVISRNMEEAYADLDLLVGTFVESVTYDVAGEIAKSVVKKVLGTPYKIASFIWKAVDSFFGLGEFAKQQGAMEVYAILSEAMLYGFSEYAESARTEEEDLFAYALLASVCDFRLKGEKAYHEFVEVYLDDGLASVSEEAAMQRVNRVMDTSYEDLNSWYNAVRYNILAARDVLFNTELTSAADIPEAPLVTLDYSLNQTKQSFSDQYEYCFSDGIWITCEGKPISFTPRSVQTVLRVRVAASDENLSGNITTVYIYAQKELPESVTVKFDGTQYIINNLLSGRAYQMAFISSEEEAVDWEKAIDFTSIDGTATVPTLYQRDYVILRSCVDVELQETYSQPLVRSVITRQPLNLIVTGSGSVCQQNSDGYYFVGESLELTAIPNVGYALDGWYVDGVQVSTDAYYIYEMGSGSEIEARFAGAQPERIVITSMPEKIEYYDGESLDMSGFELTVYYEDGSSAITSNYTASFAEDEYGKDIIVVRFSKFSVEIPVEILHTEGEWLVTYNATCISDGERAKYCNTCGKLLAKAAIPATGHSFENGNCTVCGTAEVQNDEALKIKTASISLRSDLSINFYVADSVLEGWSDPYLVFSKALYDVDGNITGYETETVYTYTLATVADGTACHVFKFSGIRAMELGSAVSATIYGTKEGILYEGKTVNYSVLTYANNMLKKTTDAKLKILLVDLLNYGATAQTYWGYNTANLVNAGLTEEQKAYATQTLPELTSCTELIKNDGATVSFKTCSLSLKEKVTVNYYLNLTSYTGEVDDLYLMLSYVDTDGVTRTATIDSKDFEYKLYNGAYYYVANFSGLNAIQMRTVCTAEVFSKTANERISNTVVYSIESYAASKAAATDSKLVELVYAMMKYGDATEAYFLR